MRSLGDRFLILLTKGEPLESREVILAVPPPVTARIVTELPEQKRAAIESVLMPGSTTLCVTADITGLPDIARWSFIATCDVVFDAIINPQPAAVGDAPKMAQFVCYGNSRGYLPEAMRDDGARARWVDDFLAVAPELRGRILGAHLQSWEHCFALLTPERALALELLQQSHGGMHFAGDYTSATAGTHGAYAEGHRAAEAALARLK